MPVTWTLLQVHKLLVSECVQVLISSFEIFRQVLFRHDAEYPSCFGIKDFLSADIGIMPVQSITASIGANLHAESYPLRIVGHHKIISMPAYKARTLGLQDIR